MTAAFPTERTSHRAQHSNTALTQRECDVLELMARGFSNLGISRSMYLSEKTIESHIGSIFSKLGLFPEDGNRRVRSVLAWLNQSGSIVRPT